MLPAKKKFNFKSISNIFKTVENKINGVIRNTINPEKYINEVVNNQLNSEIISSFANNNTSDLLVNNVFVNGVGEIFAIKDNLTSTSGNFENAMNTVKGLTTDLTTSTIGPVGPPNIKTIETITNNVIGGKIRSSLTQTNLNVKNVEFGFLKALNQIGNVNTAKIKKDGTKFMSSLSEAVKEAGKKLTETKRQKTWNTIKQKGGSGVSPHGGPDRSDTPGRNSFSAPSKQGQSPRGSSSGRFSDARLKENISFVGKSNSGVNIYKFKYKYASGMYQGVLAQEVPWASFMTDTGYWAVDYDKIDVKFERLN